MVVTRHLMGVAAKASLMVCLAWPPSASRVMQAEPRADGRGMGPWGMFAVWLIGLSGGVVMS
ncbi:hypothetical protein D5044_19045 [Verminephrobacter eiseniae]|nr:hypothetical protein [Verminephrobacter eiseniae]